MGLEDEAVLVPAVEASRARGIKIDGPLPADTVFVRAMRGDFDVVIACYHDQGLIPVKLVAFGQAVNVTLGLPIVRTSVDHGTAFDIAGRGVADPSSMVHAYCSPRVWPRAHDRQAGRRRGHHVLCGARARHPGPGVGGPGDIGVKYVQAQALADHHFTSLDIPYPVRSSTPAGSSFRFGRHSS